MKFVYDPTGDYCGFANVGSNPGTTTINYDRCAAVCGSFGDPGSFLNAITSDDGPVVICRRRSS